MTYAYIERPPPVEGIWFCQCCMRLRPFVTTPGLEGKVIHDAPLFCNECDWEIVPEVDIVQRYPEPPIEQRRSLAPEFLAAGRERWRQYLVSIAAPARAQDEAVPFDSDAMAIQVAQLAAAKGRRAA